MTDPHGAGMRSVTPQSADADVQRKISSRKRSIQLQANAPTIVGLTSLHHFNCLRLERLKEFARSTCLISDMHYARSRGRHSIHARAQGNRPVGNTPSVLKTPRSPTSNR